MSTGSKESIKTTRSSGASAEYKYLCTVAGREVFREGGTRDLHKIIRRKSRGTSSTDQSSGGRPIAGRNRSPKGPLDTQSHDGSGPPGSSRSQATQSRVLEPSTLGDHATAHPKHTSRSDSRHSRRPNTIVRAPTIGSIVEEDKSSVEEEVGV
jgi:hypothetical protein